MFIKRIKELVNNRLKFPRPVKDRIKELERRAGTILFLGAAFVGTVAILISKGCG